MTAHHGTSDGVLRRAVSDPTAESLRRGPRGLRLRVVASPRLIVSACIGSIV